MEEDRGSNRNRGIKGSDTVREEKVEGKEK